jgi:methionine sulfoxide reductase heme-binding subunit
MLRELQIWRDRRGRLSGLRVAALAFLLTPVAVALWDADAIWHGARPLNDVIHRAGFWMLTFLLTSLAITPLRRITRFGRLVDVRRMIGVGAFVYGVAHISLYAADQMFDIAKIASEIVRRVYLTIGATALAGLAVLAATSTDAMVRRLGALRWQRLHYAVYGLAVLALIHYFQQVKADVSAPTFAAGVFGWLMGYRMVARLRKAGGELSTLVLVGLSLAVAALTFAAEAVGIALAFNRPVLAVLDLDLDFDVDLDMIRPGWLVLGAGLAASVLNAVCARLAGAKPRRPRAAPRKDKAAATAPARALAG